MPLPPLSAAVPVGGQSYPPETVLRVLAPFLSPERLARIDAIVAARTFSVVPVLEGVHDAGNVSAVLRSAEGLGFGAAHLVALEGTAARMAEAYVGADGEGGETDPEAFAERDRQGQRRVSQGAHKWMELKAWPEPAAYVRWAHQAGYQVAVTALHPDARPIADWDFTQPTALVFGNEAEGVSPALLALADVALVLPLEGFVQSYNVSVAAALGLYHARQDRLARQGHHGDLADADRDLLRAHYVSRATPHAARLLAHLAGDEAED